MRSYQNILVHRYATKHKIPYILDTHGSLPRSVIGESRLKTPLRWLFDVSFGDKILKDASQVIAETELGVNEYKKFGIRSEKISLIPPPFDVEQFAQLPSYGLFKKQFGLENKKLITFLGRIHQIKGLDFLVKSFSELCRHRDDVMLVIAGNDDGYKSTLDNLISGLGVNDKVLYTGFLGGEDKLKLLVDSDVVAQTSVYEQGAWAPVEAILCGTPIIVTEHTGAGEDVKRMDAGYLVEYDNVTQMVQLITKILDNPVEAKTKAKNAAAYVRTHMSIEKRIIDYENLYRQCVEKYKK